MGIPVRFRFCRGRVYDVDLCFRFRDGDAIDDRRGVDDVIVSVFRVAGVSVSYYVIYVGTCSFESCAWVVERGWERKEGGNRGKGRGRLAGGGNGGYWVAKGSKRRRMRGNGRGMRGKR